MRYSRRSFVVLFVIMLISDILTAGGFHDRGTVWLSVNPVKIVCGLLNLEFEYVIHEKISMKVSSEFFTAIMFTADKNIRNLFFGRGPGFTIYQIRALKILRICIPELTSGTSAQEPISD